MVSAVGSFHVPSAVASTVASTASLEAQIARDKKELSNCMNCETAKSKKGQAGIRALVDKIAIAEARLDEIKSSKPSSTPSVPGSNTTNHNATNSNASALTTGNTITNELGATSNSSDSKVGRFVNLFV